MSARFCRCGCGVEIPIVRRPGPPQVWATENCRKRFWDEAHGALCTSCGETWLNANNLRVAKRHGHPGRCNSCRLAEDRARRDERVEKAARLYNEGLSMEEIAKALYGPQSTSRPGMELREARERGLIGYRYAGCARRAA